MLSITLIGYPNRLVKSSLSLFCLDISEDKNGYPYEQQQKWQVRSARKCTKSSNYRDNCACNRNYYPFWISVKQLAILIDFKV
ncbi:MAG TPA: hypothetical protein VJ201_05845 [Candidatus Babeliales bacterium]|nr:hypothetical protein [Candidatus Babeliales bacterium]